MSQLLRFTVLLPFLTLLCTCGPAQIENTEPTAVVGSIRYEESPKLLEANLSISPAPASTPAVSDIVLKPLPRMGDGHYRGRQKMDFPTTIDVSIPGQPAQTIRISPPFSDSIPRVLSKSRSVKIPVLYQGLADNENLILFLEPKDRSTPKRIMLQGPTSTNILTLPKATIVDVKPGRYAAYLIKQQLQKDSTAMLQTSLQMEYFTRSIAIEVRE